jgi:CRISPR-associated protein (TIGR03986 family)
LEPQSGDLVFFEVNDNGTEVTEFAYSSIWRGRVETLPDHEAANARTFFGGVDKDLAPFHQGRTKLTLAERVFGFVEEKDGKELKNGLRWKGRVRFSNGVALNEIQEMDQVPLRELSSPKLPSPSLYFRQPQGANRYIAKSKLQPPTSQQGGAAGHWPQGRKVYLHHRNAIHNNGTPWTNPDPAGFTAKRHVRVRPWPKGSRWRFEIRFDNLSDVEIGMLLYALQPSDTFWHKLGMGKPIGLGSVKVQVENVRVIPREERYSAKGWSAPRFAAEGLDWKKRRDDFRSGMNPQILAALEALGNPAKLLANVPISYPMVTDQNVADKTGTEELYRWFVANDVLDRKNKKPEDPKPIALQPIGQANSAFPTLKKLPPERAPKKGSGAAPGSPRQGRPGRSNRP